jgi:hypothetical protein
MMILKNSMKLFALLVLAGCQSPAKQLSLDTEAITKLLEQESATWRSGDIKAHAACWQVRPYSKVLVSTPEGKAIDVPMDAIINPKPQDMDLGGKSVNRNYQFNIQGNNAWVSHDEISTAPDGSITNSYEIRILEKVDGQWKLVAQSIHLYKP